MPWAWFTVGLQCIPVGRDSLVPPNSDGRTRLSVPTCHPKGTCFEPCHALQYVAGYTVLNDVTDRAAQRAAGQWFRGKSPDTFCPLGPFLVTRDEIPDPHCLQLTSSINGRMFQDGNTADLIFNIPFLIAFISATITLQPGDVLATGTPAGIGSARTPPVYLKSGDRIECAVECIGRQQNPVVEGPP